jgi:predicted enzyme related to lactoylglutathione lyase
MTPASPQIKQVLARVFVNSLDEALPLYEQLVGQTEVRRFNFRGIELAWVGPFLLLAGSAEVLAPYRDRVASIIVRDVERVAMMIEQAGGELVEGPDPAPNGARLIARHPDGSVFEYLQIAAPSEDQ